MSPTKPRTMTYPEPGIVGRRSLDPGRLDLPAVIRAIFDCTRNGTPVVTSWRDRIETTRDDRLALRRPTASTVHA